MKSPTPKYVSARRIDRNKTVSRVERDAAGADRHEYITGEPTCSLGGATLSMSVAKSLRQNSWRIG